MSLAYNPIPKRDGDWVRARDVNYIFGTHYKDGDSVMITAKMVNDRLGTNYKDDDYIDAYMWNRLLKWRQGQRGLSGL